MANEEHMRRLRDEGVVAWNAWRKAEPGVKPDLHRAWLRHTDLRNINLRRADLCQASLVGINLLNADLCRADLRGTSPTDAILCNADLRGADLRGATLLDTNLRGADLRGVDLRGAKIFGVNLRNANLRGASLTDVSLLEVVFANVDLSHTKGLSTCKHHGPSIIDHHTLVRSGHLPLEFLRGCGLPDTFIEHLPSLLGEAIQFYSCFISYSHADEEFAKRLHADLQEAGVRCWYASKDIQGGKKIHEQLEHAIRDHDKLLIVLSPQSITSDWVEYELREARNRERKEKRRVLFPVRLVDFDLLREWKCFDADEGRDLAREVREYFIPNFSNWKNCNDYQAAFQRLLRDLKADGSREPN